MPRGSFLGGATIEEEVFLGSSFRKTISFCTAVLIAGADTYCFYWCPLYFFFTLCLLVFFFFFSLLSMLSNIPKKCMVISR